MIRTTIHGGDADCFAFRRFAVALACITALAATGCGSDDTGLDSTNKDAGLAPDAGQADATVAKDTGSTGTEDTGSTAEDTGGTTTDDTGGTTTDDTGGTTTEDAGSTTTDDTGGTTTDDAGSIGDDAGTSTPDAGGGADSGTTAPEDPKICNPCGASSACAMKADPNASCVDQGAAGSFCGTSCKDASDCGTDYVCSDVKTVEGLATKQCVRSKLAGECPCTKAAIDAGMSTSCFAVDPSGKVSGQCPGTRSCTPKGLTKCDAKAPAAEACDGADNNCDGTIDESTCDDNNPCTSDNCAGKGGCKHTPITSACNDGNACTTQDKCAGGKCSGIKVDCNDGNVCTKDVCEMASGCTSTADNGTCDDTNPCTSGDTCGNGVCTAGTPKDCDDNNPCTADACNKKDGKCIHSAGADGVSCDDGSACTDKDTCTKGKCGGSAVICDDNNACTDDSCDPTKGCVTKNNTGKCDDNNACTVKDSCSDAKCKGADRKCDDGNVCTDDACDPQTGCTTKPNNESCNDGSKCTKQDSCADGKCKGADIKCDDGNPCTNDGCDMAKGCTTTDNTDVCSDGNACTAGDQCKDGNCLGKAKQCDDGNDCTDDVCDKKVGCKTTNNNAPCSDGNACTIKDACDGGKCKTGKLRDCDDSDPCTADSCDTKTGKCGYKSIAGCKGCNVDKQCDDGNPCVLNACKGGKCVNNNAKDGAKCTDGNFCTTGDGCKAGKCAPGAKPTCDDGNACTVDKCDGKAGKCANAPMKLRAKCSGKLLKTQHICLGLGHFTRDSFAGCNGSTKTPVCSTDVKYMHWTDLKKIKTCSKPNVCNIEQGKGVCGPPKIPELSVSVLTTEKKAYLAGGAVKVTFEVKNTGNGDAGPSTLYFTVHWAKAYGGINKGGRLLPKIPAGKSIKGTYTIILRSNWTGTKAKPRTLWVGAMADRFAKVAETNEDNNTRITPITVTSAIDLWPHYGSKPHAYHHGWGAAGKFTWYVRNVGTIAAGKSEAKLWFSKDTKLDKGDIELGKWPVNALGANKQVGGTIAYKLPTKNVKPGVWYLILQADSAGAIQEGNELNNTTWDKIAYYGFHDVQAKKVIAPATILDRSKFTLEMQGVNNGNARAVRFYDRVWASKDTKLGKGDILLTTRTRSNIDPTKTYGDKVSINLYQHWKTIKPGDWYLIYLTDATNALKEVNEKNNVVMQKVKIFAMPNIRPYYLAGYSVRRQGDQQYFTSYDRNYGTANAGKYQIKHYLSVDNKLDAKDKLLKTQTVAGLKPNQAVKMVSAWKIPTTQKPGKYYVFVVSDTGNTVKESNEKDNMRSWSFTILGKPDLRPVPMAMASTHVTAGDTVTVTGNTKNHGFAKTGTFNDRIYWNSKKALGGSLLKTIGRPALDFGKLATPAKHTFTVPKTAYSGTYYLVYYTDAFRTVAESNEYNNLAYLAVKVQGIPELRSYYFKPSGTSFKAGNKVNIGGAVRNYGRGNATKFEVRYYLSSDSKLSKDDKLLKTVKRSGLNINKNTSVSASVFLPSNLKTGTYYFIQHVDAANEVKEQYENNNLRSYKITVAASPDLWAKSLVLKTKPIKTGGYVEGWVEHINLGAVATGVGFKGAFYLSKDGFITTKDLLLASSSFVALPAGKGEKATFKFALSSAVKKGDYYLGYWVDSTNAVKEGSESNNFEVIKVKVE